MWQCSIWRSTASCGAPSHRSSVDEVAPSGYAVDHATVRQKKTGRPVRFELTEETRQAVDDYIKPAGKKPGEFLFSGRGDHNSCMTTRQKAALLQLGTTVSDTRRMFGANEHQPATSCVCTHSITRS
jgi:hypothetical protein